MAPHKKQAFSFFFLLARKYIHPCTHCTQNISELYSCKHTCCFSLCASIDNSTSSTKNGSKQCCELKKKKVPHLLLLHYSCRWLYFEKRERAYFREITCTYCQYWHWRAKRNGDRLLATLQLLYTSHLQELMPTTQPQKCQDSGD